MQTKGVLGRGLYILQYLSSLPPPSSLVAMCLGMAGLLGIRHSWLSGYNSSGVLGGGKQLRGGGLPGRTAES